MVNDALVQGDASEMMLSAGDKVKLLAKIYCHGGDVAFFGSVDLEGEAQINNSLYAHSGVYKKHIVSLPNPVKEELLSEMRHKFPSESYALELSVPVGRRICERLGGCTTQTGIGGQHSEFYKYNGKFVLGLSNSVCKVFDKVLMAMPVRGFVTTESLLDTVRRLQCANQIPAATGARWESILLARLLKKQREYQEIG